MIFSLNLAGHGRTSYDAPMRWVLAIVGMIAVGILVWRLLQWQDRRYAEKHGVDDKTD